MFASADKRAPAFDENGVMPFSIGSHCDLFPVSHFPESAGLVQGPAGGILRKDRGHQGPVTLGFGPGDQFQQQGFAHAPAPGIRPYIQADFHNAPVNRTAAGGRECSPSQDMTLLFRNQTAIRKMTAVPVLILRGRLLEC